MQRMAGGRALLNLIVPGSLRSIKKVRLLKREPRQRRLSGRYIFYQRLGLSENWRGLGNPTHQTLQAVRWQVSDPKPDKN